tara:strand:- start:182 stop:871 length:690 start_codon:yes stop_codon:yes gene_type:complete
VEDKHEFDFLCFDKRPTYGEVWDRLVFVLGMAGLMVIPDMIHNLRHDIEKKTVTIVTKQRTRFLVRYQEVMKLDLQDTGDVIVYDWFDIRSGSKNCPDIIRGEDDLPTKIVLYPSKRPKVKDGMRDMVAISRIKETEIDNWEHSEMSINHRCLQIFKKHGLKGASIGYTKKGTPRHAPIKIEHGWRETKKDIKSLFTLEELCKMKIKGNRLTNLTTNLFLTTTTFTSQE